MRLSQSNVGQRALIYLVEDVRKFAAQPIKWTLKLPRNSSSATILRNQEKANDWMTDHSTLRPIQVVNQGEQAFESGKQSTTWPTHPASEYIPSLRPLLCT